MAIKTVDEYIQQYPTDIQNELQRVRKLIQDYVPEAKERFSYMIPNFYFKGKPLVGFGINKDFYSFYLMNAGIAGTLTDLLKGHEVTGGTVHFKIDEGFPTELIKKLTYAKKEFLENL